MVRGIACRYLPVRKREEERCAHVQMRAYTATSLLRSGKVPLMLLAEHLSRERTRTSFK